MANNKNGIKFALIEKNMSEEELARYLGIDVSVVYGMELGLKRPKPEVLVQMCLIFNKTADFLMFNEGRNPIDISKKTPSQKKSPKRFTYGIKGDNNMNIPEKIKYLRTEIIEITQESLAKKLGVAVSSIKKWESGVCQPTVEHLEMLSFICGVSLNYLLFDNAPEELSLLGINDEEYNLLNETNYYFDKINQKKGIANE